MTERTTYLPVEAQGMTEEMAQQLEVAASLGDKGWEHFTPEFVGTKATEVTVAEMALQINRGAKIFEEGRTTG